MLGGDIISKHNGSEGDQLLHRGMEPLISSDRCGSSLSSAEAGGEGSPFLQKLAASPEQAPQPPAIHSGPPKQAEVFPIWATIGIVASLMTYGVLQERIMTTPFGPRGRVFTASVFLVLVNRLATLLLAVCVTLWKGQPLVPAAPLQSYAGISLSNTLATTCQYDALKYVSFPVATLAKCAKMIPVMIWGTIMNRKVYTRAEYVTAIVITLGCTAFILTGEIRSRVLEHHMQGVEYLFGGLLMATYLTFDGFTSTMQERLFREYRDVTICNQIIFCSMWSCLIALSACLSDGSLWRAIRFIQECPSIVWDISALSIAAATAQLFISFTIRKYGALAFATIMTTRQFLSILVSCAIFLNPLTIGQWISTVVIFGALYTKFSSRKGGRKIGDGPISPAAGKGHDLDSPEALPRPLSPTSISRAHSKGNEVWSLGGAGLVGAVGELDANRNQEAFCRNMIVGQIGSGPFGKEVQVRLTEDIAPGLSHRNPEGSTQWPSSAAGASMSPGHMFQQQQ